MFRYALCFVLPACAGLPVAADPICQYAGTSTTTLGELTLANPCVGYPDEVQCVDLTSGTPSAQLVLIVCFPEA